MTAVLRIDYESLTDLELAQRIADRDPVAVRLVTQRNNQRLFRVAWSILKSRSDAEDAVQSGYLKGFAAIAGFQGASSLGTWLTRIVINEALGRRRKVLRDIERAGDAVVMIETYRETLMAGSNPASQDGAVAREQIRRMLEDAVSRLPDVFRLVFVLREVEGASVEETAALLDIPPATVKTRLLRAKRRLQEDLGPELRTALGGTFPFAGADCEAMSERVVTAYCV
jgi:RNA polymerase sigma-70 factor (ECF subfamily)